MKSHWYAACVGMALAAWLIAAPQSSAKPADLPSNDGIECPDGSDDPVQGKFSIELDITPRGITLKVAAAAKPEAPIVIDPMMPAYIEQMLQHLGDMVARPDRVFNLDALLARLPQLKRVEAAPIAARAPIVTSVEVQMFEPVNVRIKDVPLKQALKNLAHASSLRIVPDYRAVSQADLDAPVSLAVENTSTHAALQQLLHSAKLTYKIDGDVVTVTVPGRDRLRSDAEIRAEQNGVKAQRLFEMAERCRRAGEYAQARACYQQVHLLTPTTLHGRMAIVRLEEIEERMREVFEEQGGPPRGADPEQVFRDMQRRSIPLGLVEVSY